MRRALLLAGLLTAAAVLAGCSAGSGDARAATEAVVPPSASTPVSDDSEGSAAWLDDGRLIGLVTYGSSSCVPVAADVALGAAGTVTVTLTDPDGACTRDYAPRVTLVDAPADVDPSAGVEIVLAGDYNGTVDLKPAAGLRSGDQTQYLPSAGWTGEDDQLVIVTWGSSGCPPVVASAAATGPAAVTVAFETPPAGQICTADFAPRATLVAVSGLEDGVAAQLTLAGGKDFQTPVTIPVSGTP